jgi:integrase
VFEQFSTGFMVGVALFALNTGLSLNEMERLRWSWEKEIPELNTSVFVLPDNPGRVVVLNSIARRALSYRRLTDRPFPHTTEPYRSEFIKLAGLDKELVFGGMRRLRVRLGREWAVAWARAGLPRSGATTGGVDDLRYTFEQRLFAAGVAWEDIDTLMGANQKIRRYTQLNIQHLLACAEKIATRQSTTVLRG